MSDRQTFEVPPGFRAERDGEGRATGRLQLEDEGAAVSFARSVASKLNELMMRLPGFRVQSHGTRVSIQPAAGHYHDAGLDCVAEFHAAFAAHVAKEPVVPSMGTGARMAMSDYHTVAAEQGELLKQYAQEARESGDEEGCLLLIRLQLVQEELAELAEAMLEGSTVGCLDALTDLTYVVDGTYLTTGLGHYKLAALAEVHRSNMSKLGPDGPITSSAGRIVKGPSYSPPDLRAVLGLGPERFNYREPGEFGEGADVTVVKEGD